MKNILFFALFLTISQSAFSASFECQTFLNLDVISSQIIQTAQKVKTPVDETDVAVSFLTEKYNDNYLLEVYLPQSDMRIYSEAMVSTGGQTITSSIWTREYMVDVVCRKLN
jgi:hypothetical protein